MIKLMVYCCVVSVSLCSMTDELTENNENDHACWEQNSNASSPTQEESRPELREQTFEELHELRQKMLSDLRINFAGIVEHPKIQADLALSESQVETINKAIREMRETLQPMLEEIDPLSGLAGNGGEVKTKITEAIMSCRQTVVSSLLTEQEDRLYQILFRVVLARGELFAEYESSILDTKFLKLSNKEKKQLKEIAGHARSKITEEIRQAWSESHQEIRRELGTEARRSIEQVLGEPAPVAVKFPLQSFNSFIPTFWNPGKR